MRYGRSKAARKTLQFFERTQGIRAPYHILLDGTFVVALVKYNLPLHDRLDRLLQHASYQLHVTQSSLDELERLATQVADKKVLLEEAQEWAQKNCASILPKQEAISNESVSYSNSLEKLGIAAKDIWNWTAAGVLSSSTKQTTTSNNTNHATPDRQHQKYFVASQDEDLLDALRTMGGVPIIRLARGSVLLLEQPSKAATVQARATEQTKWKGTVSESEQRLVQVVVQHERHERQQQQQVGPSVRRKRKAKEPNPLSCKKKGTTTEGPKKKRRRKSSQTVNEDAAAC
ncbi:U3 small nucleolar RNA-associated protein 23 [Fistulifera solaris]|uniref:U3 small nucleolar RNA-associated protein 23 n=1 Tax=Fistulifera solaris TaxID=1519565 RepID=A0A1Z5KFK2_FISSO|nr:U3 small nucleolar RNA-associated protein 23 [Fistulifera solaris]|eukprot:GAX25094.1 U3 small nucleolar RNA-associated protein 23 [Fistulifera solaris]